MKKQYEVITVDNGQEIINSPNVYYINSITNCINSGEMWLTYNGKNINDYLYPIDEKDIDEETLKDIREQ